MSTGAVIEVDQLVKVYGGRLGRPGVRALDDVSLHVARGEVFGLLGPNGAGKTTLVKILLGIVYKTAGNARLLEREVPSPISRLRVGYLPENHRFPDFLTATQLLDVAGRLSGVDPADRKRRTGPLLERVGMSRWADTRIRKYSKGMMQRLGLAQSLISDPELVFLDEPTDGVDPRGRREIRALLLWLKDSGKTVFLNSHLLSEVEKVCTRVAIMDAGKLVREGPVDVEGAGTTYRIKATRFPENLPSGAYGVVRSLEDASLPEAPRAVEIELADRESLNRLLDAVRGAGGLLESVEPLRESLEEYFIRILDEKDEARGVAAEGPIRAAGLGVGRDGP